MEESKKYTMRNKHIVPKTPIEKLMLYQQQFIIDDLSEKGLSKRQANIEYLLDRIESCAPDIQTSQEFEWVYTVASRWSHELSYKYGVVRDVKTPKVNECPNLRE